MLRCATSFFTLEKGLLAVPLLGRAAGGFFNLDPFVESRLVIAGRPLASLGGQTIHFSLVFSYLGLDQRPREPAGKSARRAQRPA